MNAKVSLLKRLDESDVPASCWWRCAWSTRPILPRIRPDKEAVKTGPVPIVGGFDKVQPLPPGGPAPRMADGHVDLTGRWYPNAAGRMLQVAYPVNRAAFQQFDPKATPEEKPSFKPGLDPKYTRPNPYGVCDQPGVPSATLEQISQHVPIELIASPARVGNPL